MWRRTLVAALLVLTVGVQVGCRLPETTEPEIPIPEAQAMWPAVPCPPGDPVLTARDRLNRIILWAQFKNQWDVLDLAARCRDYHYYGPNHQAPAEEMSEKVFKAWQHALAAKQATDPAVAEQEWLSCRGELEHDP